MASKAGEEREEAGEEAGEKAVVKAEVVEAKVNSLWHLANVRHLTSVELKDSPFPHLLLFL